MTPTQTPEYFEVPKGLPYDLLGKVVILFKFHSNCFCEYDSSIDYYLGGFGEIRQIWCKTKTPDTKAWLVEVKIGTHYFNFPYLEVLKRVKEDTKKWEEFKKQNKWQKYSK